MSNQATVVTVDGPSGSGKGTLCRLLAQRLGWHLLDSGAIYRVLALAAVNHGVALDDPKALAKQAHDLNVRFIEEGRSIKIMLDGKDVTQEVRLETCGNNASIVAQIPEVREALLARQRAFKEPPGLIADGRDMGTVVFPEADFKVFLEASAQIRAKRRWDELQGKGVDVSLGDLFSEIEARDIRDRARKVAPLVPAKDAYVLDTSDMGIEAVFNDIMIQLETRGLVGV